MMLSRFGVERPMDLPVNLFFAMLGRIRFVQRSLDGQLTRDELHMQSVQDELIDGW